VQVIVTVTPNPAVDHVIRVEQIRLHDRNQVQTLERDAGGKGINASRVIHALGGTTFATGFLGGPTGAYVRHVLDFEGVAHRFVSVDDETRINFAIEEAGEEPPTSFHEPGPRVKEHELAELMGVVEGELSGNCWLLLAGSLPQGLDIASVRRIAALVRRGAMLAVDGDDMVLREGVAAGCSFVKPNIAEAERLLGRSLASLDDLVSAAGAIRHCLIANGADLEAVAVVSAGAQGAVMAAADGRWMGETPRVAVRSTVGSGDSMVGAMLYGIESGVRGPDLLALGMAAGAATASIEGAGLATRSAVDALRPQCKVRKAASEFKP
jgi:1-phosphofructokinase family hexose kinase